MKTRGADGMLARSLRSGGLPRLSGVGKAHGEEENSVQPSNPLEGMRKGGGTAEMRGGSLLGPSRLPRSCSAVCTRSGEGKGGVHRLPSFTGGASGESGVRASGPHTVAPQTRLLLPRRSPCGLGRRESAPWGGEPSPHGHRRLFCGAGGVHPSLRQVREPLLSHIRPH
jgi:hypothetical protein